MTKSDKIRFALAGVCAVVSVAILCGGINFGQDLGGSFSLVVSVDKVHRDQAAAVIRKRVEGVSLVAPIVAAVGNDQVAIRLARCDGGVMPAVERLCRETGLLSIHLVHRDNDALVAKLWDSGAVPPGYAIQSVPDAKKIAQNYYVRTGEVLSAEQTSALPLFNATNLSPRSQFMLMPALVSGRQVFRPCFVDQQPELTNMVVEKAWTIRGGGGDWSVGVQLGHADKLAYREVTSKHCPHGSQNNDSDAGRQLAVLMDNRLLAVSTIPAVVFDGRIFIDRIAGPDEARHIRSICQSGSLSGVGRVEKGMPDPDLGPGVARRVFLAALLGGLAVLVAVGAGWRGYGLAVAACAAAGVAILPFAMVVAAGILELIAGESGLRGVLSLPVLTLWGLAGAGLALAAGLGLSVTVMSRIAEEINAGRALEIAIAGGSRKARGSIVDLAAIGLSVGLAFFLWGTDPLKRFAVGLCAGTIACLFVVLVLARSVLTLVVSGRPGEAGRKVTTAGDAGFDFVRHRLYAAAASLVIIVITWGMLVYSKFHGRQLTAIPDVLQTVSGLVIALICVAVVVAIRFGLRQSVGVLVAVINALLVSVGVFGLLGHVIGPAVAASLVAVAVCGAFVATAVFDRVKELNQDPVFRRKPLEETFNVAISGTLRQTLATCGAVLLGAVALILVCRGQVQDFGLVLLAGAICSAYSLVFVAVPVVLLLSRARPVSGKEK